MSNVYELSREEYLTNSQGIFDNSYENDSNNINNNINNKVGLEELVLFVVNAKSLSEDKSNSITKSCFRDLGNDSRGDDISNNNESTNVSDKYSRFIEEAAKINSSIYKNEESYNIYNFLIKNQEEISKVYNKNIKSREKA